MPARIDWVEGIACFIATITLTGTMALVVAPLAAFVGTNVAQTPMYIAIVVVAATLGFACTLAAIAVAASALILAAPSFAGGTISQLDALSVALFIVTAIAISAPVARLALQRRLTRRLVARVRDLVRERDDTREARESLRSQLIAQRDWYEAALSALDEAVVAVDLAGRVQFVNRAAERLMERSAADMLGRRVGQLVRVEALESRSLAATLRDAVAHRHATVCDHATLAAGEHAEHPLVCTLAPVRSHVGELLGGIVVLRDASPRDASRAQRHERERSRLVTTARQAQAVAVAFQRSLEFAERKFGAFVDHLPFPAYMLAEDGRMTFVNEAGRRSIGWREALAIAHESGHGAFDVPEQSKRYVDVHFPIRGNEHDWTGGFTVDVTDTERAERAAIERNAEIDALLQHVPLPIWIASGVGDVRCSAAARTFPAGICDDAIRRCVRSQCIVSDVECETFGEDGAIHALRITAIPILPAAGEPTGAIAFAIDATPFAEYKAVLSRVAAPSR